MGDEVRINGGHDSLIIRSTAAMADHDIPIAHPASLVDMRPKLELPFAKKALDHVLVCRHASPPLARLSVNSPAIYIDRAATLPFGASPASAARLARSVWPSAAADRVQRRVPSRPDRASPASPRWLVDSADQRAVIGDWTRNRPRYACTVGPSLGLGTGWA